LKFRYLNKKGWLVWSWSKAGMLIIFFACMVMLLCAFSLLSTAFLADSAQKLSSDIVNSLLMVSSSEDGSYLEINLPPSVQGEPYHMTANKTESGLVAIIVSVQTQKGKMIGISVLPTPYHNASLGILHQSDSKEHKLCANIHNDTTYLYPKGCF